MKHTVLYLLSLFCLAQAANLVRLADAPAVVIGFWRLLLAALILLPFAFKKGDIQFLIQRTKQSSWNLLGWIGLSSLFFFLHLLTFFLAAQTTTIANCMVLFSLNPLFTSFISYFFMKEVFPKKLLIAYPLALMGVIFLVQDHLRVGKGQIEGDLYALSSALLYALYILSCLKARRQFSNVGFASLMYLSTAVLFGGALLLSGAPLISYPSSTWLAILGTVLLPTLLGHFLLTYLLQYMNVNVMSCGKLIEPVISAVTAFFIFKEAIHLNTFIAFACTASAVLILFFRWPKSQYVKIFTKNPRP